MPNNPNNKYSKKDKVHPYISIVSPVYQAEKLVDILVHRIIEAVRQISDDYEIILVADGNSDNSWEKIKTLGKINDRVKGLKLSRNFGQHYAISAGISLAQGEWVVVMDCDLQDVPEEIPNLYRKAEEGFDMVLARRIVRQDSMLKRFSSKLFYSTFAYFTDTTQDPTVANFGIYNQKVIHSILSMRDYIRYFPIMTQWVGYNRGYLDVKHGRREEGSTSYSWSRLIKLALDNIIAFSDKPLKLTVKLGVLVGLASMLIALYFIVQYLSGTIVVAGYASLIVSIWFLSGLIIFTMGIVGIYVGKTFEKTKDRPTYIVSERINN